MKTKWIRPGESLAEAARLLRAEQVVAFPTETVYGLGAWALSEKAVRAIYEAKGRPSDNPLIVHVSPGMELKTLARDIGETAKRLMDMFWPGPLTLIFEKTDSVPLCTTGGLATVGIRMPANETALKLFSLAGLPVAAPSANLSGRPSPTTALHVLEDMDGRIPCIIDGGPCRVGLESTVLDVTGALPVILRPGAITREMLEKEIGTVRMDPAILPSAAPRETERPKAPGMKYRHYAPRGTMELIQGSDEQMAAYIAEQAASWSRKGITGGLLATQELLDRLRGRLPGGFHIENMGSRHRPDVIASRIFASLRNFDTAGCGLILCEALPETDENTAAMNRLRKAASGRIRTLGTAGAERVRTEDERQ